ncbi:unnamed protein product, partial [Thlaspi arvense]
SAGGQAESLTMHKEDYNDTLKHTHAHGTVSYIRYNISCQSDSSICTDAEKQLRVMQQIDEDHTLTQLANAWLILAVGGPKIQEAYLILENFSDTYPMKILIPNGKAVCSMHMGYSEEAETLLLEALNKVLKHGCLCSLHDAKDPETRANLVVCSLHSSSRYLSQLKLSHPVHLLVKRAEDNFERALQSECYIQTSRGRVTLTRHEL